jgi:hypothetical protein
MLLNLEKIIFITINYTTKHTARRRRWRDCRQQRCLKLRLGHIQWFQRNRFILWDYRKHPLALFRRRRRGRQSKHGRRGGKQNRQIRRCVKCIVCWSQYLTNAQTARRHHRPWCGGADYALTWGVLGPQAMVWAEAAGRHDQRKTWCEWWNRGQKQGGKSIIAYGTFSTWPS